MKPIIAVVHQKGGVGKTTVSVCLAGEFARRGIDVSLIDADKTGSARSWAEPHKLEFPVIYHPIIEGEGRDWAESIISRYRNRHLIIDCAPNNYSIGAATALADIAVLPCGPSGLDLEGTMHALLVVESVRACRANPLPVVIVPTRIDLRTLEGRQILNELEGLGEPVTQPLGYRADFVRAYSAGQSISTFAPGSPADDEIRALADEILSGLATEPNQSAAAQDGVVGTAAADA